MGDLAALGVTGDRQSGAAFGVIGARSNARWLLLPLDRRGQAHSGLEMFQPVSKPARLASRGAAAICRLGLQRLFFRKKLHLAGIGALAARLHDEASACAIFTGTDGPHRKTTVQLMKTSGEIVGYAKLTRRDAIRPFLEREARMLRQIGELALASADIPRLLSFAAGEGAMPGILVTDSAGSKHNASPGEPGPAQLRFLEELARRTGRSGAQKACGELALLAADPRLPEVWSRRFRAGLTRLRPLAADMPVALAHGDFTPWNSFIISGQRLYVFDWEYAVEDWPLGHDLAHYILATADLRAPAAIAGKLTARLAATFCQGDRAAAASLLLMSLLLHAGFYLRREFDAGGDAPGWSDGERRGALIDAMLGGGPA